MNEAKIESCDPEVGHVLIQVAEKIGVAYNHRLPLVLKYVLSKKMFNPSQIDTCVEFVKEKGDLPLSEEEFEKKVGVGVF